jgi:signal transduction histidine kinase
LIDDAISEELREVRETRMVVQQLNTVLTRSLALGLLCFVLLTAALLYSIWQAITHNLSVFEAATNAYLANDFSHRVSDNVADEFSTLAVALNNMSAKVETQRQREITTQENLEEVITHRTNELKTSNEKLEAISETRKQFLADISHELRTPLTIIQGEADLALRGDAKTTDEFHTALHRIKEQTVHTNRFVQDLLFVARADDGKAPIHKRSASIVPLIADICSDFSVLSKEKNIQIVEDYPDKEFIVDIDTSKFNQVITILLDNAIRYSYRDSVINVSVYGTHDNLVIKISDSGIGLKYNEASQVFSRFYRGTEGSGKAAGTGLGLPVAKAIIDAHGGTINLNGESSIGTTATVTLPIPKQLRAVR